MKSKKYKRATACFLTTALVLSATSGTVFAQTEEASAVQTEVLQEIDETAVPMEDTGLEEPNAEETDTEAQEKHADTSAIPSEMEKEDRLTDNSNGMMFFAEENDDEKTIIDLQPPTIHVGSYYSNPVSSVSYGTEILISYDASSTSDVDINWSSAMFYVYLEEITDDKLLTQGGTNDYLEATVAGEKWKPRNEPYTIIQVCYVKSKDSSQTFSATATTKLTVTKAAQSGKPDTPTLNRISDTSITLNEQTGGQNGVEYGYVEGTEVGTPDNWQTSTVFSNLKPGTAYTFYARYAENDYYKPSAACDVGLTVSTKGITEISNKSDNTGYPTSFIFGDEIPTPTKNYFDITGSDTGFSYLWYSGDQTSGKLTGTALAEPNSPGQYTLVITTAENDTHVGGELRLLITVASADYIVTIPASADAGGEEVSITTNNFKVGTKGRVRVQVSDGAPEGKVTLTLQDRGQDNLPTVTSRLLNGKNGTALTNDSTVALYDANQNLLERTTGKLYLTKPEETSIAAGTYTGKVVFQISYEIKNE